MIPPCHLIIGPLQSDESEELEQFALFNNSSEVSNQLEKSCYIPSSSAGFSLGLGLGGLGNPMALYSSAVNTLLSSG